MYAMIDSIHDAKGNHAATVFKPTLETIEELSYCVLFPSVHLTLFAPLHISTQML